MPATYEPIATTTLGSAASTITFSSIPNTYTDLRLVLVSRTASADYTWIRVNSDSGTNYSLTAIGGSGSAVSNYRGTNRNQIDGDIWDTTSTTIPYLYTWDFFSYAGSTNKTILGETSGDKNGSGYVERKVALWRNTSAITSITMGTFSAVNYSIGTTATLYGILKA